MKKQLLVIAALAVIGAGNLHAVIKDRQVTNNSDYVVFIGWKNSIGSKSTYIRLFPGDKYTFDAVERGYGVKGLYGNTMQVELGEKIGQGKPAQTKYRDKINAKNKDLGEQLTAKISVDNNGNVSISE